MRWRTPLRHLAAIGVAMTVILGGTVLSAQAEDLNAEKERVDAAVVQAQSDVDQSSAELIAAQNRVAQARSQVAEARSVLEAAQADLEDAQALEAQKAAELEQADKDLALARAKEAEGQAKVDAQKDAVGEYARSIYQDSLPLISVATIFNTNTTASLANRIQWTDTVLTTNQVDLDHLRDLQTELEAARSDSEDAQARADQAKQEADAQVEVTQAAEQAAAYAHSALQSALADEQAAQDAAQEALDADEAQLAALQVEQDQVNERIAEQARKAAEEAARKAEEERIARELAEAQRKEQEEKQAAAAAASSSNSGTSSNSGSGSVTSASSSGLVWPVYGPITSPYGYRVHPIWGTWRFHDGTDIGASCGTPIKAAASGQITDEYYHYSYGYRLFIDHGYVNGQHMVTSYNHISSYALPAGTWVSQGQTVAYVGTTGDSTGCHLHLMLWANGTLNNVLNYLP